MVEKLHSIKLKEAVKKVEDCIEEELLCCDFPKESVKNMQILGKRRYSVNIEKAPLAELLELETD